MVFSGAALPAAHCCLKVGPLGPDGAAEGSKLGAMHRARHRAPPLVLMCWIMSHYILEQVVTARGALGRIRCTTPQFGPLGGPVSRPERANFEATVRGRKCGSRKDHYSLG